jgi:hypothetical protein
MISLARYRIILGDRRLAAAVAASWVGRLPIGMAVLSILLFVEHAQGSFSLAGIASACYVIGIGAVARFPWLESRALATSSESEQSHRW